MAKLFGRFDAGASRNPLLKQFQVDKSFETGLFCRLEGIKIRRAMEWLITDTMWADPPGPKQVSRGLPTESELWQQGLEQQQEVAAFLGQIWRSCLHF